MKISQIGINLIKLYEGCKLTAYKPVKTEQYWTIGYGHYGPDVKEGMKISKAQADDMFLNDVAIREKYVNNIKMNLNQNQFDALVSFTYNCGVGSLRKLCLGKTLTQISKGMLSYNTSKGKVLAGLTRRRKEEQALFITPVKSSAPNTTISGGKFTYGGLDYSLVFNPTFYSNEHPDLKIAFGTDPVKLFNHFISCGMKEGRKAISTFDPKVYKARFPDLVREFKDNFPDYYVHYITCGKSEGRQAI